MKPTTAAVIAVASFWITAASIAEPVLRAANDNIPLPHHGGEHEPSGKEGAALERRKPQASTDRE